MSKTTHTRVTPPEALWAGTEHSYLQAVDTYNLLVAGVLDRMNGQGPQDDDEEEEPSYLLSKARNVSIITIRGSLTNADSPYFKYIADRVTSYPEIRRALAQAAADSSTDSILLDIASGGGSVAGLHDTANLISQVDARLKDVFAFTDSAMMSAAYWLGSSASQVFTSSTAMMGSIGVLAVHMEYSKALAEDGVGVTVMRSGKYKALVNQFEPLTDDRKAAFQAQLDAAYGVFIEWVAQRRGVTRDDADKRMGQGREFFGSDAVSAGLADGVATFDRLIGRIQSRATQSA